MDYTGRRWRLDSTYNARAVAAYEWMVCPVLRRFDVSVSPAILQKIYWHYRIARNPASVGYSILRCWSDCTAHRSNMKYRIGAGIVAGLISNGRPYFDSDRPPFKNIVTACSEEVTDRGSPHRKKEVPIGASFF